MSRADFDNFLNVVGEEAIFWSDTGTLAENIGMEIVDALDEVLGIDFTPNDINEKK